jgi:Fe2+ or Zn2+ uptake regulation protein
MSQSAIYEYVKGLPLGYVISLDCLRFGLEAEGVSLTKPSMYRNLRQLVKLGVLETREKVERGKKYYCLANKIIYVDSQGELLGVIAGGK